MEGIITSNTNLYYIYRVSKSFSTWLGLRWKSKVLVLHIRITDDPLPLFLFRLVEKKRQVKEVGGESVGDWEESGCGGENKPDKGGVSERDRGGEVPRKRKPPSVHEIPVNITRWKNFFA